jgi:hypothetical protein
MAVSGGSRPFGAETGEIQAGTLKGPVKLYLSKHSKNKANQTGAAGGARPGRRGLPGRAAFC